MLHKNGHGWKILFYQMRLFHIKKSDIYKKCFKLLGLPETADQNTVRKAYIELVKKVHPDSGLPEASALKFHEVDEAFKTLQEKFAKNRRGIYDDEEEKVFDIRHTAPQHRQYLNFDGIGFGTPAQRQKQYYQVKAMKAQERVLNHRVQKAQAGEQSLMNKGPQRDHNIRTKYGFDRVVEDLIQEAMSKGDFDNLSGTGKPLPNTQSQNPYLDFTTHKLNKIMLDNGFMPEWITLQREIREEIQILRHALAQQRYFVGDVPLSNDEQVKWQLMITKYETDVQRINKKIDKFNLIAPLLENQLFRIKLERISNEVLNDENIPRGTHQEVQNDKSSAKKEASSNTTLLGFLGSLF